MGHYCRICGRYRANERFSSKGHRIHVCSQCSRLPKHIRFRIEVLDEIWGFLSQSNISAKNIRRLSSLAQSDDDEVRETASIVLAIGKAHPGRRRRYRSIKANQPELWQRMLRMGIVEGRYEPANPDEDFLDTAFDPDKHAAESESTPRNEFDDEIPF